MPSVTTIRNARRGDATTIAALLAQLGYPTTVDEVVARLASLETFDHAIALVAEGAGEVAGVITGHIFPTIHASSVAAWITTLVVDANHIHQGIGRQLAGAIEEWARTKGATRLSVTSANHREGAHAFYESIGYERSGVRLTKALT